jgi:hypothetical protein
LHIKILASPGRECSFQQSGHVRCPLNFPWTVKDSICDPYQKLDFHSTFKHRIIQLHQVSWHHEKAHLLPYEPDSHVQMVQGDSTFPTVALQLLSFCVMHTFPHSSLLIKMSEML